MFVTPTQAVKLSMHTGLMLAEAQMVIAMRLWGMAGLWNVTPEENSRMVQEKTEAMTQSAMAAGRAMLSGKGAAGVAMAALKPVRMRTRSNMKRLTQRGPGTPG
ncbi:antifreeze protein [Gemmobacter fulvus]|uniref:Antifreeze protein n=1 Tax=Gemmobacter fulvus TaxID=2840474 RepID=A0A975P450_9RHOB|nr:antifreeze protein [Gemmobacter fulvus]MBT9246883.1 antifreeze protein [Gemmobacter fulvus]QWK89027.1 antifreeze protein [Gemmobacter fulvus]